MLEVVSAREQFSKRPGCCGPDFRRDRPCPWVIGVFLDRSRRRREFGLDDFSHWVEEELGREVRPDEVQSDGRGEKRSGVQE